VGGKRLNGVGRRKPGDGIGPNRERTVRWRGTCKIGDIIGNCRIGCERVKGGSGGGDTAKVGHLEGEANRTNNWACGATLGGRGGTPGKTPG